MKSMLIAATAAAVLLAGNAYASEDLAKSAGCTKCHEIDKKKKGPSFKSISAKFKGKGDAAVVGAFKDADHDVKVSDGDLGSLAKWILSL